MKMGTSPQSSYWRNWEKRAKGCNSDEQKFWRWDRVKHHWLFVYRDWTSEMYFSGAPRIGEVPKNRTIDWVKRRLPIRWDGIRVLRSVAKWECGKYNPDRCWSQLALDAYTFCAHQIIRRRTMSVGSNSDVALTKLFSLQDLLPSL